MLKKKNTGKQTAKKSDKKSGSVKASKDATANDIRDRARAVIITAWQAIKDDLFDVNKGNTLSTIDFVTVVLDNDYLEFYGRDMEAVEYIRGLNDKGQVNLAYEAFNEKPIRKLPRQSKKAASRILVNAAPKITHCLGIAIPIKEGRILSADIRYAGTKTEAQGNHGLTLPAYTITLSVLKAGTRSSEQKFKCYDSADAYEAGKKHLTEIEAKQAIQGILMEAMACIPSFEDYLHKQGLNRKILGSASGQCSKTHSKLRAIGMHDDDVILLFNRLQ